MEIHSYKETLMGIKVHTYRNRCTGIYRGRYIEIPIDRQRYIQKLYRSYKKQTRLSYKYR